MSIILPRQCDSDFIIQISSNVLIIHEGTAFAKTSTVLAEKIIYDHYASNIIRISGFPNIPQGSKITVTFKAWIPDSSFIIYAHIDKLSQISTPIMKQTAPTVDTIIPTNFVSNFRGNQD